MSPRLYLDENVTPELARLLRARGYDVVSCYEVGAEGDEDEVQLARAADDGRALLTYDHHDFRRIADEWFRLGRSHAGIVISYRQYDWQQLGALARATSALLAVVQAEDLMDCVFILDQFQTR